MPSLAALIIGGIVAIWVGYVLVKDRQFVRSIRDKPVTKKRIVTWAELALRPLVGATEVSQTFVREAYNAPNVISTRFSLWNLVLVTVAAIITAFAMFAEFNFLAYSLALFLNEGPTPALSISTFPLSAILALVVILLVGFAGLVLYDGLGKMEESVPAAPDTVIFNHRLTKFAFHGILLIAIVQAAIGYSRGDEFLATANYQAAIYGDAPTDEGSHVWGICILNIIIGFAVPWISAFGTRYLLTLITWIFASIAAVILFLFLWLPTWKLNGLVVRYQNEHGLPPVAARERTPDEQQPQVTPGTPADQTAESTDPLGERMQEEREELIERREAEQRERWRVNFNPFGK